MITPQQIAPDILCLAHTSKKIEWCDRAETCERHVAIRRNGIGDGTDCTGKSTYTATYSPPCEHKNGWYVSVPFWVFIKRVFVCSDCGEVLPPNSNVSRGETTPWESAAGSTSARPIC